MAVRVHGRNQQFEAVVWPHASAAYHLARWICRNEADAADIVQESFMRAIEYLQTYRGGDSRSWLLAIVRNTAHTWLKANRRGGSDIRDESGVAASPLELQSPDDPMTDVAHQQEADYLRHLIAQLPLEQREVLVLREFEDLSYRQIATVVGSPIGTVMSRLARARDGLAASLHSVKIQVP